MRTLYTEICSVMDVGNKSQDLQNNCVVHAVYAVSTTILIIIKPFIDTD